MVFYPEERIAIFIDGANLYSAARGLAFDIDYKRLLELFSTKGRLIRAFYYTALVEDQEYSPIRPLVDWLDYNGYTMVTKPTKEFTDAMGRRRIKGNMDIELAIDMLEMAEHIDHAILFSGDGDFRRLVEAVQRRGVRVSVVSTIRSSPPMASDDLRRQADSFIELQELAPGLRGANRTGRPFTGDFAGDLLYRTLSKFGLATGDYGAHAADGLALRGARITNAVRCVPPQNKPETNELGACRR